MADVTAGAARYASVAEVRADVERAGGDASGLCGFGRCFCVKTALGIRRKERGHWPQFQESERSNRRLLATAIAAFDSLESDAKDWVPLAGHPGGPGLGSGVLNRRRFA